MQKSTVGGILSIVAGAWGIVGGLLCLTMGIFFQSFANDPSMFGDIAGTDEQFVAIFTVIYCVAGVFCLLLGVLGVVGGVFALQRKHWGWALAGAITGCLSFLPVGVGAVVLLAMGRSEFAAKAPVVATQPSMNTPA